MTVRDILFSAAGVSTVPASTTGVFGAQLGGGPTVYGQSALMPDGRMAVALAKGPNALQRARDAAAKIKVVI